MQNVGRERAIGFLRVFDLLVAAACFLLADHESCPRIGPLWPGNLLSMQIRIEHLLIFALFLFAWHCLFTLFGLYRPGRSPSVRREILDVFKATSAGCLILVALGRVLGRSYLSPHFGVCFWAASSFGAMIARLGLRYVLNALRLRRRSLHHLLVVGTNRRALEYARKVESKPELGYVIVGFVENGWSGNGAFSQSRYKVVTDFEKFPDFVKSHVVDEVMVCLPLRSHYEQSARIAKTCEEQGIIVRFPPDLFDLDLAVSRAEMVDDASVLTLRTGAMQGRPLLVKRWMDFLLSAVLLLVTLPGLAMIALLVKLTSPGPVFFTQMRPGLNKRPFAIIKFRTMVKDADEMINEVAHLNEESGPAFKIQNDPRITPFGRFLRKTSLDELPQLINVLKGEMSLVGPRPLFYWEVDRIEEARVQRRFSVKPGITGLWQVSGRSNVSFDRRILMDLNYIDNWSLIKDLQILARTVLVVMNGRGAV